MLPPCHNSAKFAVIDVLRPYTSDGRPPCPVSIFCLLSWEQVAGYNLKDARMSFTELQPQEGVLLSSSPVSCLGHWPCE